MALVFDQGIGLGHAHKHDQGLVANALKGIKTLDVIKHLGGGEGTQGLSTGAPGQNQCWQSAVNSRSVSHHERANSPVKAGHGGEALGTQIDRFVKIGEIIGIERGHRHALQAAIRVAHATGDLDGPFFTHATEHGLADENPVRV